MPDSRHHRGPAPGDAALFGTAASAHLTQAVFELSWLRSRGYVGPSALKLVGDRHALSARQRDAVSRCACSEIALAGRLARRIEPGEIRGQALAVDTFNVLLTVEAALGGAVVLLGRDGCARDLGGVHGSYRRVSETRPALEAIGFHLAGLGVEAVTWLIDAPVSNSGRLRSIVERLGAERGWRWKAEVVADPDRLLAVSTEIVATADSAILDAPVRWFNLARSVIDATIPGAFVVDLAGTDQAFAP